MRVLLTGATGFIGSRVLDQLLAERALVRVLVRPETLEGSEDARRLGEREGVEVSAGDLGDLEAVSRAAEGVEVVFHLAWRWQPRGPEGRAWGSGEDQLAAEAVECNIKGTEHLLRASVASRVRRLVFTSSVAVYGPPGAIYRIPVTEETEVVQRDYGAGPFVRSYMAPKIAIEGMIRCYSREHGLEFVILRPSVVYGPGAPFAERLVTKVLRGPRWISPEADSGYWQMVHVEDLSRAVVLAGSKAEARNQEFNIAGDDLATQSEIKTLIWAAASRQEVPAPEAADSGSGAGRFQEYEFPRYDIGKARRVLGYSPQVPLGRGIHEMVRAALARSPPESARPPDAPTGVESGRPAEGSAPPEAFDIRSFYDERVESEFLNAYFEHSGFWNFGYRVHGRETPREACENLVDRLLDFIPEKGGAIVDVACGNGATTRRLTRHYAPERVTGVNFSARQVARCLQNAPGCRFAVMDATRLAFRDGSVENMICVEAAFHFNTREAFLREALRVLKPGGRLVLADAVLPKASQTQPEANYVDSRDAYEQRCRRMGFADVVVMDATPQCWAAFAADLAHYTRRKLRRGEIERRRFYEIMIWLRQLGPERYLLASCLKG